MLVDSFIQRHHGREGVGDNCRFSFTKFEQSENSQKNLLSKSLCPKIQKLMLKTNPQFWGDYGAYLKF